MKPALKILLFEDSPEDFLLLENALEGDTLHRFSLTRTERLQDGLNLLRRRKFDAILLDLDLPDSYGLDTFEQVLKQAGDVPIVVCSGNTDESNAVMAVRKGAQDYIVKGATGFSLAPRILRYSVERYTLQKTLQASERRFSILFHSNPVPVGLTRASDYCIVDVNTAWERLTGYTRAEVIGRTSVELGMAKAETFQQIRGLLGARGEIRQFEMQLLTRSGDELSVWLSSEQVELDNQTYFLNSLLDITERKQAEQNLRESEERLELVMEGSQLGYWDWNIETGDVYRNARWAEILGYTLEEIEFNVRQWTDLHHPDDRDAAWKSIQDHLDGKTPAHRIEYRMRAKDGSYVWILDQARVVKRDSQGKPLRMCGTHTDITERKQAEQKLRESHKNYQNLFDNNPHPMWVYDLETLAFLTVNEAAIAKYGYKREEFLQMTILDIRPPEDHQRLLENVANVTKGLDDAGSWRHLKKDGSVIDVEITSHTMEFYGIQAEIVLAHDITERKKAEEALHRSEIQWRTLVQTIPDFVALYDSDGNYLFLNHYAEGFSEADIKGKSYDAFLQDKAVQQYKTAFDQARLTGRTQFIEYQGPGDKNEARLYDSYIVPILDGDRLTNYLVLARDITDRKRSEALIYAQRDLARSVGAFITIEAGLKVILDTILELTGLDSGGIYLFSSDYRTVDLIQHKGLGPEFIQAVSSFPIDSMNVQMILHGEAVYFSSEDPVIQSPLHLAEKLRALAVVPVLHENRVIGCLDIASHTLNEIPLGSRRVMETLAVEIGNVILYLQSQAALRASEEKFRQIAENINEVFWMFDNEAQKLIYLNPAFEKTWGISSGETLQDTSKYILAIHPEDRRIMLAALERQARGEHTQMEYRIVQPNGSVHWIFDRSFPILSEDGRVLRTTGVATDITERKQAEEALKRRMEDLALTNKLNNAVNQGEDLIAVTDLLSEEMNAIFGSLSTSLYLLDQNKTHLTLQHFTMPAEKVKRLEKLIGRALPQINIPIGGSDHFNRALSSEGGFLISGLGGISEWLEDFANTSFLPEKARTVIRKVIPAAAHMLNIHSVISIPLKTGSDVLGLIEFTSEGEFDESILERFQNIRHQLTEVILRKQVEQSLRESNEKYRLLSEELEERVRQRTAEVQDLYDSAPTGYHSLAANGCFLQVNQTELNWLGYTREELIGHSFAEFISKDSQTAFRENFPIFKQRGWVRNLEFEMVRKDGSTFPVLLNATAIFDEQKNFVMSRSTVFDNTERKKAEQALLESRENLQHFFDTASDLIQSMDENGSYLYVNAAWSKTLGYTAEEASRLRMLDVIDPSHHEHCRAMLRSLIIDQHPQQLEVTFRTKQGQEVVVEGSVSSRKDKNGHIATNGIFRNITERKRAEEALRQSEATYRALFESTNDAIFLIDMSNKIIRSNSRAPELLGYDSTEDIIGQNADRFVDPSQSADANERMNQLMQFERLPLYERKFVRKNGEKIDTEINLSLIKDVKGQPMLIQSVVRDISQRKAVEQTLLLANTELERALRMKDEFLANMSHELRTPLNAILGLSDSLFEGTAGPINEKQGHYLITINESGRHLLNLINDILDLAKIESGQIKLDLQNVHIQEVCQASIRMVKQLAHKKTQAIDLEIASGVDLVCADERRLKQMIVNLLSNAVKFTPENGKLGVEVKADRNHSSISITVWDQGIGIAKADLKHLFQPFFQLDSSLSRESSGTGLGLALVAEMARLHGGSVSVESEVEKGSRFTIHLPWNETLSIEPEPVKKSTGRLVEKLEIQTNKVHTILLVEDTEYVIMMLRDYLTQNGYHVAIANNGLGGVEQAKALTPDLILMDVQMPGMDGLEATRRIRQEAGLVNIPIIALTALAMPSDRDRCLEAGMNDYISKPVNLKNLVKIIQKYVSDPAKGKETRRTL